MPNSPDPADPTVTAAQARARARAMWRYVGQARPPFAQTPGPGQESVWDYPRPPRLEPDAREVLVMAGPVELARTRRALRLLETASPPTFYLPPDDLQMALLRPAEGASFCEWKGEARYWAVLERAVQVGSQSLDAVAWSYAQPLPGFEQAARSHRVLPVEARMFRGRRARVAAAGALLRRLDHARAGRAVQG